MLKKMKEPKTKFSLTTAHTKIYEKNLKANNSKMIFFYSLMLYIAKNVMQTIKAPKAPR